MKKWNQYEDSKELSRPTTKGIRIIDNMSTGKILRYVAGKHKFALVSLAFIVSVTNQLMQYFISIQG